MYRNANTASNNGDEDEISTLTYRSNGYNNAAARIMVSPRKLLKDHKQKEIDKRIEAIKRERLREAHLQEPKELDPRQMERWKHLQTLKEEKRKRAAVSPINSRRLPIGPMTYYNSDKSLKLYPLWFLTTVFLFVLAIDGPLYRYTISISQPFPNALLTFLYLITHASLFRWLMNASLDHGFDVVQRVLKHSGDEIGGGGGGGDNDAMLEEGKKYYKNNMKFLSVYLSLLLQMGNVGFVLTKELLIYFSFLPPSSIPATTLMMQTSKLVLSYAGAFFVITVTLLHLCLVKNNDVVKKKKKKRNDHNYHHRQIVPPSSSSPGGAMMPAGVRTSIITTDDRDTIYSSDDDSFLHSDHSIDSLPMKRPKRGLFQRPPPKPSQLAKKRYNTELNDMYTISELSYSRTQQQQHRRGGQRKRRRAMLFIIFDVLIVVVIVIIMFPNATFEDVLEQIRRLFWLILVSIRRFVTTASFILNRILV